MHTRQKRFRLESQPCYIRCMRLRQGPLCLLSVISLLGIAHCGGNQMVCKPDELTGVERCEHTSDSMGNAAVAAGAAAATWAVVGCTVNGCAPPTQCNTKTKQCEPIPCDGPSACPTGYECAEDTHTCH